MNRSTTPHRLATFLAIGAFLALGTVAAHAQSVGDLSREVNSLSGELSSALHSDSAAQSMVEKLDHAEADFAKIANNPKANKAELLPLYDRLESMLSQLKETYQKKKDDCIAQIDQGGAQCDYSAPEQVGLAAAYPLAWLRFTGATSVFSDQPERAKRLLTQAIDDFTQSSLAMPDPNLVRENVLGRAYCERELGKYDKADYDRAIQDFKQIMSEGSQTKQYKAAQQGLATTYAAMGNAGEAQKYSQNMGSGGGAEMFRLQTTYTAMYATKDSAKRAAYLKEIVDAARSKENDKEGWAVAIAAIAKYSHNPIEELGSSSDPFAKHLLANVLLAKKQQGEAAKYFVEAARSGKYPKDYKYAADIYYNQHNMSAVESILNDLTRQPNNPDAQWASYMRYKLPRAQWEQSGGKNTQLEQQWQAAADDYLKKYTRGTYANEVRFRLAERTQAQGKYADAAKMYSEVSGGEYGFAAKFNAAECNYLALVAASSKDNKGAAGNPTELRGNAVSLLRETIKMEPEAERSASSAAQRKFIHDTKGRAIYMLVGLLQGPNESKQDATEIASLLSGYEEQYPSMKEKSQDIFEWRTQALNSLGRYDDIEQSLRAYLERNQGNTQNSDFIKTLGIDFWKDGQTKLAKGDQHGYEQDARLTKLAYSYFENMVATKKMQPKNLTGTLSILGQAYMATGDEAKAEQIFNQVVKADAASPDANAGLARIAQAKKDYKDAVTLWTNVENTAAESDNLWYDAKYNIAEIYAAQGNTQGACSKLAQTRAEHPSLGTPEMAAKWNALQRKLCLDHKH
jgi:lipopolysaccharide biosynthesis regulator YciM